MDISQSQLDKMVCSRGAKSWQMFRVVNRLASAGDDIEAIRDVLVLARRQLCPAPRTMTTIMRNLIQIGDRGSRSAVWAFMMSDDVGVVPDVPMLNCALRACDASGLWSTARSIVSFMASARLRGDSITFSAALSASAWSCDVNEVVLITRAFIDMRTPVDGVVICAFVKALAYAGDWVAAELAVRLALSGDKYGDMVWIFIDASCIDVKTMLAGSPAASVAFELLGWSWKIHVDDLTRKTRTTAKDGKRGGVISTSVARQMLNALIQAFALSSPRDLSPRALALVSGMVFSGGPLYPNKSTVCALRDVMHRAGVSGSA